MNTHLKFNIAPEKLSSERKVVFQSSNLHFSAAMLNFRDVDYFFTTMLILQGRRLSSGCRYSTTPQAQPSVIRDQILILRDLEGRELRLDIHHLLLDPRNRRVFQISAVMSFFAMVQNLLGEVKAMVASAYTLIGHTASVSCTSSPEPGIWQPPQGIYVKSLGFIQPSQNPPSEKARNNASPHPPYHAGHGRRTRHP